MSTASDMRDDIIAEITAVSPTTDRNAVWLAIATALVPYLSSGIADGDKGDIIVSFGGTVWTIDPTVLAGFAAASHTHPESDITSLVADLAAKAPLVSPTFTGDPKAPTPAPGDNDTSIATTAFVVALLAGYAAASHTHPESDITSLVADLAAKAPLVSPTFTGDPKAPTPAPGDNDTSIATTGFVATATATLQPYVRVEQNYLTAGSYSYSRPAGVDNTTPIEIIIYGAGGAGGGGSGANTGQTAGQNGGGGGGAGARVVWRGRVGDLTWPLSVTVGAGASAANGGATSGSGGVSGSDGGTGGTSIVTGAASAYGGGGGKGGSLSGGAAGGGGGGGVGGAGSVGTSSGGLGGLPAAQALGTGGATGGAGGQGSSTAASNFAPWAEYGGGGGGGRPGVTTSNTCPGGTSFLGGGGGGVGGAVNSSSAAQAGTDGGTSGSISTTGGGGGAFNTGANGSDGSPGSRYHGGTGGAGGSAAAGNGTTSAFRGGTGGSHGGGGGGGGACRNTAAGTPSATGGAGGAGGDGAVYIIIG